MKDSTVTGGGNCDGFLWKPHNTPSVMLRDDR